MAKSLKQQIIDLEESISKAQVKIEELKVQQANEISEDRLTAGTVIVFVYGKGDGKRDLEGQIVGVKAADPAVKTSSVLFNVAVGEGYDAQLVKVGLSAIKRIVVTEAPAEPAAE